MVFSKATRYGVKALAYMAHRSNARICGVNEIAGSEIIPPVYLRKLLGELRRHRLVESVKGLHGGYVLARDPQSITLWEVFRILDPDPYLDECILCGSREEGFSCSFCMDWRRICGELIKELKRQTIADFLSSKGREQNK
jgi:Rrf2 family protein